MQATILVTGKCKDKNILAIEGEYIKRLKPFIPSTVIELPHAKASKPDDIKFEEAHNQLAKIPQDSVVISLDERGKSLSTRKFAQWVENNKNNGIRHITFVIGGAEGLDESVRQRADLVLSLSALTFPHMMVRPILLEQLYRVATIIAGHPYHRD